MDEEKFNIETRKFLKKAGINCQQLIEQHVRDAIKAGRIVGHEQLEARITLEIGMIGLKESIDGTISLK